MKMKIGVISDTHIPERATKLPPAVTDAFKDADMIIHAGDLTSLDILEALRRLCPNVKAVCGNMDPYEVKNVLPEKEILEVKNYKIGIMHGYGSPAKLVNLIKNAFKEDNVDIIIFGHSHSPMNEKIDNILFFNPGSATDKIFSEYNSFGIIEINDDVTAKIIRI